MGVRLVNEKNPRPKVNKVSKYLYYLKKPYPSKLQRLKSSRINRSHCTRLKLGVNFVVLLLVKSYLK